VLIAARALTFVNGAADFEIASILSPHLVTLGGEIRVPRFCVDS